MKSMMRRPFEKRPVGWWKNVSPYGRNATWGGSLGSERPSKFSVSAMESRKLMIDLKRRHYVAEFAVVRNSVNKMKVTSFFTKGWEEGDVMWEAPRSLVFIVPSDFESHLFVNIRTPQWSLPLNSLFDLKSLTIQLKKI